MFLCFIISQFWWKRIVRTFSFARIPLEHEWKTSYQQRSMMMRYWRQFVGEWEEEEWNLAVSRSSQRLTALMSTTGKIFLLNLSAPRHWNFISPLPQFIIIVSACVERRHLVYLWHGVCLSKLFARKLIINELLPPRLNEFSFSSTSRCRLLLLKWFTMMMPLQ